MHPRTRTPRSVFSHLYACVTCSHLVSADCTYRKPHSCMIDDIPGQACHGNRNKDTGVHSCSKIGVKTQLGRNFYRLRVIPSIWIAKAAKQHGRDQVGRNIVHKDCRQDLVHCKLLLQKTPTPAYKAPQIIPTSSISGIPITPGRFASTVLPATAVPRAAIAIWPSPPALAKPTRAGMLAARPVRIRYAARTITSPKP